MKKHITTIWYWQALLRSLFMSLEDIRAYEKVGERRFREVHGLFYEDVVVGEVVEHRPGRTVTEADNVWGHCSR